MEVITRLLPTNTLNASVSSLTVPGVQPTHDLHRYLRYTSDLPDLMDVSYTPSRHTSPDLYPKQKPELLQSFLSTYGYETLENTLYISDLQNETPLVPRPYNFPSHVLVL